MAIQKRTAKQEKTGNEKANERLSAYVGISAPETPKYLLTNNFLAEYFQPAGEGKEYSFESFQARGVLYTEDSANKERLRASFNKFLYRYLGEEAILEENRRLKKHFYFPLTPEMLTDSTPTLRHMLYHLQRRDKGFCYEDMQRELENYIFNDASGLNYILKILFQSVEGDRPEGQIRYKAETETLEEYWEPVNFAVRSRMTRLGRRLNEDLHTLLTHEYFLQQDFYRRYHYLSTLLTSYVIQYILARKDSVTGILCKGNPQDSRLNGMIHRACCSSYEEIRKMFATLLKQQYEGGAKRLAEAEGGQLRLYAEDGKLTVNDKAFADFAVEMTGGRRKSRIDYGKLLKAFDLAEGQEKQLSAEGFVLRYIELTGTRRGSTLTKLSSTLSTSGRQIEMVYPRSNAKQKYFAMSESLAEFYVRLYLAGKDQQYDYLDNFIDYLAQRYRIVITKSKDSERLLKAVKPKLTAKEFAGNLAALIHTLDNVNCLIKLSDSGYVITLPEKKGDFRLL